MKKVLIMCNADPNTSPRPNRMVGWLKDEYRITVVGRQIANIKTIENSFVINTTGLFGTLKKGDGFSRKIKEFLSRLSMFVRGDYEAIIWASLGRPHELLSRLASQNFDLIISHDCTLLPLTFSIREDKATKVILDAREFYPKNFDDQFLWRKIVRPLNEYLCAKYLPLCDKVVTVSDGIAQEYRRIYQINPEVIMSMPQPWDLSPTQVKKDEFKIIHHGSASPSRKIELMIEMMDYVDDRFSLDLMLVYEGPYLEKLRGMAEQRKNVTIIPPVKMQEIVSVINRYDIGLFLCPPTNFNLEHALPNKLFEFIQARLAVAIGPSTEMKRIVESYNCGIVSKDFRPQSLATTLNNLSSEEIIHLKHQSHLAARKLNAEVNRDRVVEIVREMLEED